MTKLQDLTIYNKSKKLISEIYSLLRSNKELLRDYSINGQIKRASISVACNISEGFLRSKKQTNNYLEIASGSANEVITLLEIINTIYNIDTIKLQEEYQYLAKQINAFASRFK